MTMPQTERHLLAEGAEFLVLGQLLVRRIPAVKAYTGFKGYDLMAFSEHSRDTVRIQVKARMHRERVFPGAKFEDCEVVVLVQLNRSKDDPMQGEDPAFYVLTQQEATAACEGVTKWNGTARLALENCPADSADAWHKVRAALGDRRPSTATRPA